MLSARVRVFPAVKGLTSELRAFIFEARISKQDVLPVTISECWLMRVTQNLIKIINNKIEIN